MPSLFAYRIVELLAVAKIRFAELDPGVDAGGVVSSFSRPVSLLRSDEPVQCVPASVPKKSAGHIVFESAVLHPLVSDPKVECLLICIGNLPKVYSPQPLTAAVMRV